MLILMPKDVAGLTNASARSLERVPIRTRDSNVTRSAWRMEVECDGGTGGITVIELSSDRVVGLSGDRVAEGSRDSDGSPRQPDHSTTRQLVRRGDGLFLGWPQERLAEVYDALLQRDDEEPPFETLQLG